jgi:hypothetical protein
VPAGARGPFVLLLATWAVPAVAHAQVTSSPTATRARLVYVVDPAAAPCPSADEFRAAANARAGHELFGEPATATIEVSLRREGEAFVATVALPDTPGEREATRELRSAVGCAELASAAALVASIALDPASLLRPSAEPKPEPPATPASETWRALLGGGPRGVWGLSPGPTVGLALSAAAVKGRTSLGVELRGLVPRDASYGNGSVAVLPLALSLLPCRLGRHVEACAVGVLGLLRGAGAGFDHDFTVWRPFGGLGARGGLTTDLGRLRLRASLEGDVLLPRTQFLVGTAGVYATRSVSVSGGLDALLYF